MKGIKGINTKYVLVGFVVVVTVVLLVVVQTKQPKIKNSVKKGLKDNDPSVNTTQLNKPTETDAIGAMGGPAGPPAGSPVSDTNAGQRVKVALTFCSLIVFGLLELGKVPTS